MASAYEYEFEYSEDEEEEDERTSANIQSEYYRGKDLRGSNVCDAIQAFFQAAKLEPAKGEWGFKAFKQIVKLYFTQKNYEVAFQNYKEMLLYIKSPLPLNYSDKSIHNMLDYFSSRDVEFYHKIFPVTLEALREYKNERLWFKTCLRLAKLYLDRGEYPKLSKTLRDLHNACKREDGGEDFKKGTQLLEVYALEVQMYTIMANVKRFKEAYHNALMIKSGIPHPFIVGIIRECGGKMHLSELLWGEAHSDFVEAFKNYNEAASFRSIQCLKYLFIVHMHSPSEKSPLDLPEAKMYKNEAEVVVMANLVVSYQSNDVESFERILRHNEKTITKQDDFIKLHIEQFLKKIRTQALLRMLRPYTRIHISAISQAMKIVDNDAVEQLLVSLILDKKIAARIDHPSHLLLLDNAPLTGF